MKENLIEYFNCIIQYIGVIFFIGLISLPLSAQITIQPDDRDDFVKRAQVNYENQDWEGGKLIVDEGLKKYPKDSDLKMMSGKYFHVKQHYDKARYELVKALEQNPDNVDAKQILVNVEMESKRYSSAICYVNELLEVNPYWRGLWRKKIELYDLQGNHVEANRLRKRISQIYPEDSGLKSEFIYSSELAANENRKSGNIDEAIKIRKSVVQAEPHDPSSYFLLINDYLLSGDQANALVYTERALHQFPDNVEFMEKKVSILTDQKRYSEALSFLQQKMKTSNSPALRQQYNYYLLRAAQNAKDQDPATLYGKIFNGNPGNQEAFNYIFDHAVGNQQYEEALHILSRHRLSRGNSKSLSVKELMVYNRMGNIGDANSLTKKLFAQYPNDTDLQEAYVIVIMNEAKAKMADERYAQAIEDWQIVKRYGDNEMYVVSQNNIYNAYLALKDYHNAQNTLTEIISEDPVNGELHLKRADVYMKLQRYPMAISSYERAMELAREDQKRKYLTGYQDMLTEIVKDLNEQSRYTESMDYVKRWLDIDPSNKQALQYAVNLSHQVKNEADMLTYAKKGNELFPDDIFFKIKLAQLRGSQVENYEEVYTALLLDVEQNPYNEQVVNTLMQVSEDYAKHLIKEKQSEKAIEILDAALVYAPENKSLKYLKGVAYEKQNNFKEAHVLQSFYEPSLLEINEFKNHMNYLKFRSYDNQIGLYHLRSRFGDNYTISTISTIEYTRFQKKNTYTGRIHYTGREPGKGIQGQVEWGRDWNEKTRTKIDFAMANQFFSKVAVNASVYRDFNVLQGIEAEIGLGYRKLYGNENLMNLVVGVTKELDPWRLNVRFNNFLLEETYLYNLSAEARYYFSSPKSYMMAVGSIGCSPDVDLIDYQLFNGFSVLNSMVGAGAGHMIYRSVSVGLVGTWHNYQTDNELYKNLYNLYVNLNVAF